MPRGSLDDVVPPPTAPGGARPERALDASFVGPNPAINAFQKSGGELIRIVAGLETCSGGSITIPTTSSLNITNGHIFGGTALDNVDFLPFSAVRHTIAPGEPGTTVLEAVRSAGGDVPTLFYQYGLLLPASPFGYVGQGLGQ